LDNNVIAVMIDNLKLRGRRGFHKNIFAPSSLT